MNTQNPNSPRRPRINPALLLGGANTSKDAPKDVQPSLAQGEDFDTPTRVNPNLGGRTSLPGIPKVITEDNIKQLSSPSLPALPGLRKPGAGVNGPPQPVKITPVASDEENTVEGVDLDDDVNVDDLIVNESTGEVVDSHYVGRAPTTTFRNVGRKPGEKPVRNMPNMEGRTINPRFLTGNEPGISKTVTEGSSKKLPPAVRKPTTLSKELPDLKPHVGVFSEGEIVEENSSPLFAEDVTTENDSHIEAVDVPQETIPVIEGSSKEDTVKESVVKKVNPRFVTKPGSKPLPQYHRKQEQNITSGEWSEDSEETRYGLGGEADLDFVEPQYSKAFHLTKRDITVMRFLARYRYAYSDQIARLVDSPPRTIVARMRVLEKRGFLRREPITEKQYLWTTRKAGNLIADIAFPEIKKGSISYATIAHTIGLGNLGVEFEREMGGLDLLGEGKGNLDWVQPQNRWKMGLWGNPDGLTFGEMTVTEREIRQGQLRWRGNRSTKEMRDLVSAAAEGVEGVELEEGQEGLFVVYGAGGKGGEHIPDLAIARPRAADGSPQNIAIELELTPKTHNEWRKIVRNYRDNGMMFSKVYYFTHKKAIGVALNRIAEEEGMSDRFIVRKYTPANGKMPFWG